MITEDHSKLYSHTHVHTLTHTSAHGERITIWRPTFIDQEKILIKKPTVDKRIWMNYEKRIDSFPTKNFREPIDLVREDVRTDSGIELQTEVVVWDRK